MSAGGGPRVGLCADPSGPTPDSARGASTAAVGEGLRAGREQDLQPPEPRQRLDDPFAEARVDDAVSDLIGVAHLERPTRAREVGFHDGLHAGRLAGGGPAGSRGGPILRLAVARPVAMPRVALPALDLGDPTVADCDHHVPDITAFPAQGTDLATDAIAHSTPHTNRRDR